MKYSMFGIHKHVASLLFVLALSSRSSFTVLVDAFSALPIVTTTTTTQTHHVRSSCIAVHSTANSKHIISHNGIRPSGFEQPAAAAVKSAAGYRNDAKNFFMTVGLVAAVAFSVFSLPLESIAASDAGGGGASVGANAKITTGGASTLQSGRTIAITRGVNLDNSDFHGQNLKGVAFQQSIVRDANFRDCNLVGASFFDATVDGSDFENADLTQANFEMAQFNRASLKNAIVKEMYVSGATLFEGIKNIEGSDWTDTYLRADQRKYLCSHPTATGTNPVTGQDTRDTLMCGDDSTTTKKRSEDDALYPSF